MFKPGNPKPPGSGRKMGVKNRKTVLRVEDVLLAANLDPVAELLKILPQLEPKDAVRVWLELQSYIEPKARAGDAQPDDVSTLTLVGDDVSDETLIQALDELKPD